MPTIHNPILRGFNPDPSICRVGEDFYIAVSTFQWFPGVLVYHSRNLETWTLASRPLQRRSQLDMAGNPSSGGIWAPCLTHAEGQFWLIYTDVKNWAGSPPDHGNGFKDTHNYLVTAPDIQGPWSEPIYLNSSGFDPSLFHDEDGKKYLLNQVWDYRPGHNSFAGIVLQEYDHRRRRLVGPRTNIFSGTDIGVTEAPHLYKRGDYYYLMTAEGGTEYAHAVTLARSKSLTGPYELHPQTPLLSSVRDRQGFREARKEARDETPFLFPGLQKAGHGSMVPWQGDEWILAHLCGRPLPGTQHCPLGRETALQRLTWREDAWPWPDEPGPRTTVEFSQRPGLANTAKKSTRQPGIYQPDGVQIHPRIWQEDFNAPGWSKELQTLRIPADDRYDIRSRPGWLRLTGAESPTSRFRQSLLARRAQSFRWRGETKLSALPEDFQQFAGLVVRYDEATQYILRIQGDGQGGQSLGIIVFDQQRINLPLAEQEVPVDGSQLWLAVRMDYRTLQFEWSQDGSAWQTIGPELDASKLSDEYAHPMGFTGTFLGLGCFDLSGRSFTADFDYLTYQEEDHD